MVSYSAFWGGIGIPTLMVLGLILLPYLDRSPKGVGVWFSRERLLAVTLFILFVLTNLVLIVIGTFFRGPNWSLVLPW
jgi:quinol-cytochrome oxidoreductase complex cytochrome b subunit